MIGASGSSTLEGVGDNRPTAQPRKHNSEEVKRSIATPLFGGCLASDNGFDFSPCARVRQRDDDR